MQIAEERGHHTLFALQEMRVGLELPSHLRGDELLELHAVAGRVRLALQAGQAGADRARQQLHDLRLERLDAPELLMRAHVPRSIDRADDAILPPDHRRGDHRLDADEAVGRRPVVRPQVHRASIFGDTAKDRAAVGSARLGIRRVPGHDLPVPVASQEHQAAVQADEVNHGLRRLLIELAGTRGRSLDRQQGLEPARQLHR